MTETPITTPTPSSDYVYKFPKDASSYTISKKGADYVVAVSREDLVKDIETGKAELQDKPLVSNSVLKERWSTLSKDKLIEKSEILSSNASLLRNFEITDGEGMTKTITVTKDGKTYVAVVTPDNDFENVTINVTTGTSKKNIELSDIEVHGLVNPVTQEVEKYQITEKITGLTSKSIEVKAVVDADGETFVLQKKAAGIYNTILEYVETDSAYEIRVNKVYASELCEEMSVGNVFADTTVEYTFPVPTKIPTDSVVTATPMAEPTKIPVEFDVTATPTAVPTQAQ